MKKSPRLIHFLLLPAFIGVAYFANAAVSPHTVRTFAGTYTLEGAREMAATLILHQDKRFEYGAIYGGADLRANGVWSVSNKIVHLVADQRAPRYTDVDQQSGPLSEVKDDKGISPAMAIMVATPSLDMRWSGVTVTFKFANGRTRNGMTSRSGIVYVGARQEPEWKDVPVTELGLTLPGEKSTIYWVKVKDRTITKIAVEFDPGAMAQAFREGHLEIEDAKPLRLVADRSQGDLRGTYVWAGPAKSESNL